jgi:hypothetical protein
MRKAKKSFFKGAGYEAVMTADGTVFIKMLLETEMVAGLYCPLPIFQEFLLITWLAMKRLFPETQELEGVQGANSE